MELINGKNEPSQFVIKNQKSQQNIKMKKSLKREIRQIQCEIKANILFNNINLVVKKFKDQRTFVMGIFYLTMLI